MKLFAHDRHKCDNPWDGASARELEQAEMLAVIIIQQETIMSALTDLQSAIADLGTALAANTAEIETLLTKITAPGTSDADIAAAVQSIRDLTAANTAEVAKAQTAAP